MPNPGRTTAGIGGDVAEDATNGTLQKAGNHQQAGTPRREVIAALVMATGLAVMTFLDGRTATTRAGAGDDELRRKTAADIAVAETLPEALRERERRLRTEARQLIDRFFQASTLESRLDCVLHPERIAGNPALHDSTTRAWDGIRGSTDFRYVPSGSVRNVKNGILVFAVSSLPAGYAEGRGTIITRETPGGLRFDWETFQQTHLGTWPRFLQHPDAEPGVFRLVVRKVPLPANTVNPDTHVAIRLSGIAHPRARVDILLSCETELGAKIATELEWGRKRYATLAMAWEDKDRLGAHVVLDDFVCWEILGVGNNADEFSGPR